MPKYRRYSNGVTPLGAPNRGGVGSNGDFRHCHAGLSVEAETLVIRLEAKLQPNIGFTWRRVLAVSSVHASGYNSAESEPIWIKSGALWVQCRGLALKDFGRDPSSSDSWGARRNFMYFCQESNARFYRFPVGQISRNLNMKRRSVSRWKLSEENFKILP